VLTELFEDTSLTAALKHHAAADYGQYEGALISANITRQGKLNLGTAFSDDARVFLIVGFMSKAKLMTHAVLMRKDGGQIYVMNSDGPSDTPYSDSAIGGFLAGQTAQVAFAGKQYMFTGIAYRVWKR
jgi:hypothetical protein